MRISLTAFFSDAQKQQLLFAPATNKKTGEVMPQERIFKTENTMQEIVEGKKKALKHKEFTLRGMLCRFPPPASVRLFLWGYSRLLWSSLFNGLPTHTPSSLSRL